MDMILLNLSLVISIFTVVSHGEPFRLPDDSRWNSRHENDDEYESKEKDQEPKVKPNDDFGFEYSFSISHDVPKELVNPKEGKVTDEIYNYDDPNESSKLTNDKQIQAQSSNDKTYFNDDDKDFFNEKSYSEWFKDDNVRNVPKEQRIVRKGEYESDYDGQLDAHDSGGFKSEQLDDRNFETKKDESENSKYDNWQDYDEQRRKIPKQRIHYLQDN